MIIKNHCKALLKFNTRLLSSVAEPFDFGKAHNNTSCIGAMLLVSEAEAEEKMGKMNMDDLTYICRVPSFR